jgi:hypothetical protein
VSAKVVVSPEQLAKVASDMVAVADQVHGAVIATDSSSVGDSAASAGANSGFATSRLAEALWSGWRSELLDDATKVAQFGDDLGADGGTWSRTESLVTRSFTQPVR